MKKSTSIIILVSLLVIVAFLAYLIFTRTEIAYSPSAVLEECKSVSYNGENKINLVMFASKETADEYASSLFSFSPYKENSDSFNVYYIDSYSPECSLYQNAALLCNSRETIKKAASCPNDYIIVIKDSSPAIRSSTYSNIVSINSIQPATVFVHEFSHALATLADEYVPASLPRSSKNCVSSCDKFANSKSCFKGCSKADYYRSVDSGIMKTLFSQKLGDFDEELIKQKISEQAKTTITGKAISQAESCQSEQYYLLEGNFAEKNIEIISKTIEQGCLGSNGAGPFTYSIIKSDETKLQIGEFNAELIFTDIQNSGENSISGGSTDYEGNFYLKIPVIENAKSLEITTPEKKTISVNLADKGARPCET